MSEERLRALEERLRRIEERLGMARQDGGASTTALPTSPRPRGGAGPAGVGLGDRIAAATTGRIPTPSATGVMAAGAAAAFLLAAVYFIKLVYDAGWLTPERQLALALLSGVVLILGGLALARHDRAYAAWLPAPGVAILFLTLYAGHLWYDLLPLRMVLAGVGVTSMVAIALHRHFARSVYALAAVAGAYSFPVLLPSRSPDLTEVIIYFAAWGLLFSWLSLQEGSRLVYLTAAWLALIGFDAAWRASEASEMWRLAAGYHFAQFLLFAATAAFFAVRHRRPMGTLDALVHGGALFTFYGIEYVLIRSEAPRAAPIIALASAAIVLTAYLLARSALAGRRRLDASGVLVSAYVSWVSTHVLFFELLPSEYRPWAVLLLPLLPPALEPLLGRGSNTLVPVRLATAGLFVVGLLMLLGSDPALTEIPLPRAALFLYAAVLYTGAWRQRRDLGRHPRPPLLLYAGHLTFLVATVNAFESSLAVSVAWAILAVVLLVVALRLGDRVLGRSSLLVFSGFALKVLLVDLTGSPSLMRVGTLVVLGGSLYAGGWLYQRMPEAEVSEAETMSRSSG